jgi:hypothetical protein
MPEINPSPPREREGHREPSGSTAPWWRALDNGDGVVGREVLAGWVEHAQR